MLYLNEVIDVGWITGGQTAEDDQNLSAGMSWHVSIHTHKLFMGIQIIYK